MIEQFKYSIRKEEEFLEQFPNAVSIANKLLKDEWKPNYLANDKSRNIIKYFLTTGEVENLVFDSASIYHNERGFSSLQLLLRSSKRRVTIRVEKKNGKWNGEKIFDKSME
jgi:hypothetical protein